MEQIKVPVKRNLLTCKGNPLFSYLYWFSGFPKKWVNPLVLKSDHISLYKIVPNVLLYIVWKYINATASEKASLEICYNNLLIIFTFL